MAHDSAPLGNSLFSPLHEETQFYSLQEKWKNQMGINCNVIKLRLKLTRLVVLERRKDEIDLYTPSPAIYKTNLQIEKYYSLKMTEKRHGVLFLQLWDNARFLTKNFESNSLIRTQTHTRRLKKLGREVD